MTLTLPAAMSALASVPASIPSPTVGALHLGPIPIRGYAMAILLGIVVAVWIAQKRLEHRGAGEGAAIDLAFWAVPFGIVGGRLYHVITSPERYFGDGGRPMDAFKIWEGGLGIWGAVALGALGMWFGARRMGLSYLDVLDAAAPGVAVAQGIGRWGNWFNNEIYGSPTDLPWGVVIHRWDLAAGRAVTGADGQPIVLGTFHPTFLYESLFCLLLAAVLMVVDWRAVLARGQVMALYVAGYPVGRIIIEKMRTDHANVILGQRVNVWVSIIVFLLGVALFMWFGRRERRQRAALGTASTS